MTSSGTRFYTTECVVLRHTDLGEADRIVVLLTPDRGLLRAVAKGVRKPSSKSSGHLDLLRHVSISVHVGRTLDVIGQAETVNSFRDLHRSLDRLSKAFYLCELTERFSLEGAAGPGTFRMLVDSLGHLPQSRMPSLFLRWYEMRILHLNGFQPEIQQCADCASRLAPEFHTFSALRGGIVCPKCRPAESDKLLPASVPAVKLLRYLRRADWDALDHLRVGQDELRECGRILEAHLEFVLERDVKSAGFVKEVESGYGPGAAVG